MIHALKNLTKDFTENDWLDLIATLIVVIICLVLGIIAKFGGVNANTQENLSLAVAIIITALAAWLVRRDHLGK